ncbi:MAG: hypothetical protein JNK48_28065 [Bryobacterales bacterium]|nr:hypothetical protein [Bryobacterales bacterium]
MSYPKSLLILLVLAGLAVAQTPRSPGRVVGAGYSIPAPLKVAPGQVITVFVHSPNGIQPAQAVSADAIPLPFSISGFSVKLEQTIGSTNVEVPLFAVYPVDECVGLNPSVCTDLTAITLQIPWEVTANRSRGGRPDNFAALKVFFQGTPGDAYPIQPESDSIHIINTCDSTMPPGFDRNSELVSGGCRSLVTHLDGRLVTPANPASAGETLVMYAFGLGPTGSAVRSGDTARSPIGLTDIALQFSPGVNLEPVRPTALPPPAGNAPVPVFAGLIPSQVGLYQVTFSVPALAAGSQACTASTIRSNFTVSIGRFESFDGAGICIQP